MKVNQEKVEKCSIQLNSEEKSTNSCERNGTTNNSACFLRQSGKKEFRENGAEFP
jgi:hypothetical protein